ncbi:hypothetical protein SBADM41S_05452 [Streptomyces badius]
MAHERTNHQWDDFTKYAERDHWLWKEHANPPGGHGGMDYIMVLRLMQCMRLGLVPDFDVHAPRSGPGQDPCSVRRARASVHQGQGRAPADPGPHSR